MAMERIIIIISYKKVLKMHLEYLKSNTSYYYIVEKINQQILGKMYTF